MKKKLNRCIEKARNQATDAWCKLVKCYWESPSFRRSVKIFRYFAIILFKILIKFLLAKLVEMIFE